MLTQITSVGLFGYNAAAERPVACVYASAHRPCDRHWRKLTAIFSVMNAGIWPLPRRCGRFVRRSCLVVWRRAANGDTHGMSTVDHLHRAPRGCVENTRTTRSVPNPAGRRLVSG